MIVKTEIKVRYAETDQMGIVHHSNYPIWYEVGRTEFIKEFGMTYRQFEKEGLILPLLSLDSNFILPAFYEDELSIHTCVLSANYVKLEFYYEIYRKSDGKLINTGHTIHGIVEKNMRPCNIKKKYPNIYQLLLKMVHTPKAK